MSVAMKFGFADGLVSERLKAVHAAWSRVRAGRMAPRREEITPTLLRSALPWIWIVDVVDTGADFRFRLAGDRVIQFMGRRYAGSLISEHLDTAFFQRMRALFAACATERRPVSTGPERSVMPGKEFLEIEVVALPLSEDGRIVSGLFGAIELRAIGEFAGGL